MGDVAQATINQDLDLIKSCIEVTRVAARRAAVHDKDRTPTDGEGLLPLLLHLYDRLADNLIH